MAKRTQEIDPARFSGTIIGVSGDLIGQQFRLGPYTTLGRATMNSIVVEVDGCSRNHCEIELVGSEYIVRDLGSTNGTRVNQELIKEHLLEESDVIQVGAQLLKFSREMEWMRFEGIQVNGEYLKDQAYQIQSKREASTSPTVLVSEIQKQAGDNHLLAYNYLQSIYLLQDEIHTFTDQETFFDKLTAQLFKIVKAEQGSIYLYDPNSFSLNHAALLDISEGIPELREPLNPDVIGECLNNSAGISFTHAMGSTLFVPMFIDNELIGAIQLDGPDDINWQFNEIDLLVVVNIARQLAAAIDRQLLHLDMVKHSRVESRLERFLSQQVIDQLMDGGDDAMLASGEEREVTILFSDIRGFTNMSTRYPPAKIVSTLNEYFDLMVKAIFKYGGTLDKFIGDAIMAIWGSPVQLPNDPVSTVRAAIEMQQRLAFFNEYREQRGLEKLSMGIGINSGPAIVGNVGSSQRMEFTAIGGTVNMCSRIERFSKAGDVLVSSTTHSKIKSFFPCESIGSHSVKGYDDEIEIFKVMYGDDVDEDLKNRRTSSRENVSLQVICQVDAIKHSSTGVVWDISTGGLCININSPDELGVGKGQAMTVSGRQLESQGIKMLGGIIRWVRSSANHGYYNYTLGVQLNDHPYSKAISRLTDEQQSEFNPSNMTQSLDLNALNEFISDDEMQKLKDLYKN